MGSSQTNFFIFSTDFKLDALLELGAKPDCTHDRVRKCKRSSFLVPYDKIQHFSNE